MGLYRSYLTLILNSRVSQDIRKLLKKIKIVASQLRRMTHIQLLITLQAEEKTHPEYDPAYPTLELLSVLHSNSDISQILSLENAEKLFVEMLAIVLGRNKRHWLVKSICQQVLCDGLTTCWATYASLICSYGNSHYGDDVMNMSTKRLNQNGLK
ncbi:hypothetical protein L2E82_52208 [Cichorium intybus]|nr:hypothetical protein L2E82_52208 [Cichorium intybus]